MNSPPETPPAADQQAARPTVSDADLLNRHIAGDPHAFSEIVKRHRDRMWAVALRTLGDPDEAADAVQDAFVSAYRKAESFRGEAAVTTWLHRIVVNACLDRMRRKSVRPVADDELIEAAERDTPVPDQTAEREVSMEVSSALKLLPADQRAALVLVDMMGYSVEDAAHVLQVPSGTVKSRCARGRAKLVPILSHLRNRSDLSRVSSAKGAELRDG
ncbi:RNA polymerase sigma factor SigM [Planobispora longispora]|uniref:RNA polymerase sigma factor SigM n=1 Tax=Planobispora longispora TaxID=28887 RepID=UPI00194302AE|nr:RNA polymerase sigma factor SigM [Planobispora longispora]